MRHNFLSAQLKLDQRADSLPEHSRAYVQLILCHLDNIMNGEPVEAEAPHLELIAKVGARRQ